MSDAIAIAVIAVVFLSVAAFGAAVGYRLVQRQLSERVIGLVAAAVSPILHAGAVFVWAGLGAALAAYMAGRRAVSSPG